MHATRSVATPALRPLASHVHRRPHPSEPPCTRAQRSARLVAREQRAKQPRISHKLEVAAQREAARDAAVDSA
eukprot:2500382-Prymnesium_polylepis.1